MLFRNHTKRMLSLVLVEGPALSLPPGDTIRDDVVITQIADVSQNTAYINSGLVELLNDDGTPPGTPGFPSVVMAEPGAYGSNIQFQRVRLDKIMWIVNASYAALGNSAIDAYAAEYGIADTSHRFTYAFGPNDNPGLGNPETFYTAISDYVRNNDIDMILLSLGTPVLVSFTGGAVDLAPALMNCGRRRNIYGGGGSQSPVGAKSREVPKCLSWRDTACIPCGRLGIPLMDGLGGESIPALVTMARKSIAASKTDNHDKRMVQGFYSRAGVNALTDRNHKLAWQSLVDHGFTNRWNYVNTDDAFNTAGMSPSVIAMQTSERLPQSWASIRAGTANPKVRYFLGWFANNNYDDGYPSNPHYPFTSSFEPDPDYGVCFSWTSYGFTTGHYQLQHGACAMFGSYLEPYTSGLPLLDALLAGILTGLRLCEAHCLYGIEKGVGFWKYGLYGDPLGAPFAYGGINTTSGDQKYDADALATAAATAAAAPAVAAATSAANAANAAASGAASAAASASLAANADSNPSRSIQDFIKEQPGVMEYDGISYLISLIGGVTSYDPETSAPLQPRIDIAAINGHASVHGHKVFEVGFYPADPSDVPHSVTLFDSNENYLPVEGYDTITPPAGNSVWRVFCNSEYSTFSINRIA